MSSVGLFDWFLLTLAAIIVPPIIQAIFARRDSPIWRPETRLERTLADRLARDRTAETLERQLPGDVHDITRPNDRIDGTPDFPLHSDRDVA